MTTLINLGPLLLFGVVLAYFGWRSWPSYKQTWSESPLFERVLLVIAPLCLVASLPASLVGYSWAPLLLAAAVTLLRLWLRSRRIHPG